MTTIQKIIKYLALALAIVIIASIIAGIISAVIGIIGGLLGIERTGGERKEYTYAADEIRSIELDVSAANLEIRTGDSASVVTYGSRISVRVDNGVLKIEEEDGFSLFGSEARSVTVTLPDIELQKADIDTGAGQLTIEGLKVRTLELDLGAGNAELKGLTVTAKTDIDCGVGNVELSADLLGETDIDCGVGSLRLTLTGTAEDYTVRANKGVGDFTVDGTALSDGGSFGSGSNRVTIDSGVGSVHVNFEN